MYLNNNLVEMEVYMLFSNIIFLLLSRKRMGFKMDIFLMTMIFHVSWLVLQNR